MRNGVWIKIAKDICEVHNSKVYLIFLYCSNNFFVIAVNDPDEELDLIAQLNSLRRKFEKNAAEFADVENPLVWWRINGEKYSVLIRGKCFFTCLSDIYVTERARMYLAIPSERVFSGAGYVFSKRRQAMSPETLSSLVFCRENMQDEAAFTASYTRQRNAALKKNE